jgi:hypothetical protein
MKELPTYHKFIDRIKVDNNSDKSYYSETRTLIKSSNAHKKEILTAAFIMCQNKCQFALKNHQHLLGTRSIRVLSALLFQTLQSSLYILLND